MHLFLNFYFKAFLNFYSILQYVYSSLQHDIN